MSGVEIRESPDPYNPRGKVKLAYKDGHAVGRIRYDPTAESMERHQVVHIDHVHVDEQHRGEGIARSLYQSVRDDHPDRPILHSVDDQSRDGNELTRKLTREDPAGHLWLHWAPNGWDRSYKHVPPRRKPPLGRQF